MRPKPTGDQDLYCADLEWLLQGYDRDMGRSGTLAATVAILEHGGPGASGSDVVEAMIERLDRAVPAVARARRLLPRWARLRPGHRGVLTAYYSTAGKLPARADALLGRFATTALYLARGAGLRRLLRALAANDGGYISPVRKSAEGAVRGAHKAWRKTADKEADRWAS